LTMAKHRELPSNRSDTYIILNQEYFTCSVYVLPFVFILFEQTEGAE
jgi:hypothetical protein